MIPHYGGKTLLSAPPFARDLGYVCPLGTAPSSGSVCRDSFPSFECFLHGHGLISTRRNIQGTLWRSSEFSLGVIPSTLQLWPLTFRPLGLPGLHCQPCWILRALPVLPHPEQPPECALTSANWGNHRAHLTCFPPLRDHWNGLLEV